MSGIEQRRAWILTKLLVGEVTVAEAAALLQLSQRQVWRLKVRFERDGPAGLVHANRGRASPRRLPHAARERILALARGRYAGSNDSHLAELLAEHEAIAISRAALRRLLRGPRRTRQPRRSAEVQQRRPWKPTAMTIARNSRAQPGYHDDKSGLSSLPHRRWSCPCHQGGSGH